MIKLVILIIVIIIVYNTLGRAAVFLVSAAIVIPLYLILENAITISTGKPAGTTEVKTESFTDGVDLDTAYAMSKPITFGDNPGWATMPAPTPIKTTTYSDLKGAQPDADEALTSRMQYTGSQAKEAIDIRAKHSVHKIQHLFKHELDENENREWWNADDEMDAQLFENALSK